MLADEVTTEEPEAERYFCDRCRHKVWKDPGFGRGRKKARETVDEVTRALDREQHADGADTREHSIVR